MSKQAKIQKSVHVVKPQYLYKKCRGCDEILSIDHYSKSRLVGNMLYTHGKCKICRAAENQTYFNNLRILANKGKEQEKKEKDEEQKEVSEEVL
jgi:hypothetical protein